MRNYTLRTALAIGLLFCALPAGAQIKTAYFMENSVQRYDLNAALTPARGYVNFPLIGNTSASLNNNFFSINNLIYPHGDGHVSFLHESVSASEFLRRVPRIASLDASVNANLIGFGKYHKSRNYFWSAGWNLRAEVNASIPKEFFSILKDLRVGSQSASGVSLEALSYSEMYAGVTIPTGWENLVIGGRVKFLIGLAHTEIRFDDIAVTATENELSAELSGTLKANILGMDFSRTEGDDELGLGYLLDFGDRFSLGTGFRSYGAAIDLGAEMKFLDDRLKVSAGINDLGFMVWGGSNSFRGELDELRYEITGLDLDSGETKVEKSGDAVLMYGGNGGYVKRLGMTMNVGVEYNFLDNLLGVGLLSHSKFASGVNYTELTLSCNVRPCNWFSTSLSHSMIRNKIGIFGLALNFHPKGVNIFLGADYIPLSYGSIMGISNWPTRGKSLNFNFGLAFSLGREKPW